MWHCVSEDASVWNLKNSSCFPEKENENEMPLLALSGGIWLFLAETQLYSGFDQSDVLSHMEK